MIVRWVREDEVMSPGIEIFGSGLTIAGIVVFR